ncbi:Trichome birefringence-like family [Parasponia andersonii]|uniref:Trichome birefringence-like family n=1 Tax=Parasponia andersonii TaxID=3476 RepID=A0A2P5AVN9_PARAD|nr:Trichome birefringence-like family [Parasponia andersonii]
MKHTLAKNHHHHQFPHGIIKNQKYNTKKFVLLALISLVILTTVSLYHPSRNHTSFFFTTSTGTSSKSSSSSSLDRDDFDAIGNITIPPSSTHESCDIFSGEWIPNPEAPYYTNTTCSAIHQHQNCMKYGRPDSDFMKWKWKPDGCDLPVFNPAQFLELVRDKSLAFVGDSVARNQMQSLICLLSRVEHPIDVSYNPDNFHFKRWKYITYNFTMATFWTPHLVKAQESDPNFPNKTGLFRLHLDEFDEAWTAQVEDFDYIIISAGHWFLRPLTFYENRRIVGCLYCDLEKVTDLGLYYGYRKAFRTAFKAINGLKNYKGITYLRTFAPSHFENGLWNQGGNCARTRPFRRNETTLEGQNRGLYMTQVEEFRIAEREGRKRGLRFRLLDTTQAMLLRPDGHPSRYGHWPHEYVGQFDCVHWCLPGPIDTWSDFLLEMMKTER